MCYCYQSATRARIRPGVRARAHIYFLWCVVGRAVCVCENVTSVKSARIFFILPSYFHSLHVCHRQPLFPLLPHSLSRSLSLSLVVRPLVVMICHFEKKFTRARASLHVTAAHKVISCRSQTRSLTHASGSATPPSGLLPRFFTTAYFSGVARTLNRTDASASPDLYSAINAAAATDPQQWRRQRPTGSNHRVRTDSSSSLQLNASQFQVPHGVLDLSELPQADTVLDLSGGQSVGGKRWFPTWTYLIVLPKKKTVTLLQ